MESYKDYNTVNDWFIRQLKPGVRPTAAPYDDNVFIFDLYPVYLLGS